MKKQLEKKTPIQLASIFHSPCPKNNKNMSTTLPVLQTSTTLPLPKIDDEGSSSSYENDDDETEDSDDDDDDDQSEQDDELPDESKVCAQKHVSLLVDNLKKQGCKKFRTS